MDNETPDQIEPMRRAFRNSAAKLAAGGQVEPIDAALGALYATHDLAMHAGMDAHGAIEWMRTGADLMERQLLARDTLRHAG